MFPSRGHFSSFPCPFYVNGLCERPFCHFRHSKHDVERAKEDVASCTVDSGSYSTTSVTASGPSLRCSSPVDSALTSEASAVQPDGGLTKEAYFTSDGVQEETSSPPAASPERDAGSFAIPSFTDNSSKYQVPIAEEPEQYSTMSPEKSQDKLYSVPGSGLSALPTYLPTPKTPSLPAPPSATDDSGVPVYQPTPKRELKRQHDSHVKHSKGKGTDLEYDPESNFSCGGLVSSSQDKTTADEESLDYQPCKKKARILGTAGRRKQRLSCDSLVFSPSALGGQSEDEEMPDARFSDEEDVTEPEANKVEDGIEEEVKEEDEQAESFMDIGDDDISSDDDFVDVPDLPLRKKPGTVNRKQNKDKPVTKISHVTEKTTSSSKNSKMHGPGKAGDVSVKQRQSSRDDKSTACLAKVKLKVSSSDNISKIKPSSSSSSQKGLVKDLPSSEVEKHGSKKSSSVKGHCSDKAVKQTIKHAQHSSKTEVSKHKSHSHSGSSSDLKKRSHTSMKNSSKDTLSKDTSAKSISSPKKQLSEMKQSSSSSKGCSEGSKVKGHSSGSGADKSVDRLSNSDSKGNHDFVGSGRSPNKSADRRSSSDGKLKHHSAGNESGTNKSIDRHSSSERHSTKHISSSAADRNTSSRSSIKAASESSHASVSAVKDSKSMRHSSDVKHSSKESRSASLTHGAKQSSSHSKKSGHVSSESSQRSHTNKRDLKVDSRSKDRPASPTKVPERTEKDRKLSNSRHDQKHSSSSSRRTTGQQKVPVADSSFSHEKEKQSLRKSSSTSSSKASEQKLVKMNSTLFGDDSDEDSRGVQDDDVASVCLNGKSEHMDEEDSEDYSRFLSDGDFEEEDTFDECLRIFQENPVPKRQNDQREKKLVKDKKKEEPSNSDTSTDVPGKKRIAYKAAEQSRKPGLLKKERPRPVLDPSQVMHNRIMEMQRKALERAAAKQAVQEQEVSSTSGSTSSTRPQSVGQGGEKKRVAHMPKPVSKSSTSTAKGQSKVTLAVTASKTEKRVAHTPNLSNLKRPVIPASFGSKVPSNIRQRYLNLIIDECLKFCPNEEKSYKKALEEEAGVYDRSSNKNIYLRVAVNTITRLRSEAKESMPGSSTSSSRHSSMSQSHQATLGGSRAAKTSFTLHRSTGSGKKMEVVLTAPELYQKLLKYSLTEEQLVENGYPRPCQDSPGRAVMVAKKYQDTDTLLKGNERTCCRCGKRFIVDSNGMYVRPEECVYHWTRAYPRKVSGFIQHIYNCCSSDTSTPGCQVASNHVHEKNKHESLTGFMRTLPRSPPRDGNFGIYALDCEMVYTLGGLELARVTVVDTEGETVYESLVQPFNSIVDYNTRFSGLTAADLKDVETTLTDVQAILLNRFSDKTILMGHSLESDLFALKLIHSTVVDTSVVFPHRLGPPYKRALRNLMLETFQKIIQSDEGGHDSKEDAVACLQLMKWRIKEDSKREARYSRD